MQIKVTQEYFIKVIPEWYNTEFLSGEGTLEDQILEAETKNITQNAYYLNNVKRGATTIEVVTKEEAKHRAPLVLNLDEDSPY